MPRRFAGFAIRGFRSFYELQHIALTGRLNVLAGVNNSGKSNVLLAAEKVLSPVVKSRTSAPSIDTLDRSQFADDESNLLLTVGFAANLDVPPLESLERAVGRTITRGTQDSACMELFAQHAVGSSRDPGRTLLWMYWTERGNGVAPDPEQVEFITTAINDAGQSSLFNQSARELLQRNSSGVREYVSELLVEWLDDLQVPEVVLIPAQRRITHDGQVSPDLMNVSGTGFTGLLQALQAPSAHRYRQDRARFEKINDFLKNVLDDRSAEITIPYDSSTVHVSLAGRVLPLANLGSGIEQVVLLATLATQYEDRLLCIEEPEIHIHPVLLRKLTRYLLNSTTNMYLLSTHSAHLLDAPDANILTTSLDPEIGTTVQQLVNRGSRAALSQRLGYRASDLVQSNAIVWVEGPSDRIFVRSWLQAANSDLLEGIHYSVLFYGGRLLSHYMGGEIDSLEPSVGDFISMLDVNRNMAIIIDSDKKDSTQDINATKKRLIEAFDQSGAFAWITAGREIENYVPEDIFVKAVQVVHPTVSLTNRNSPRTPFSSRFTFVKPAGDPSGGKVRAPDKVRIASVATDPAPSLWDVLDLVKKVTELVHFIEKANDLR